ncbi:MAG TPA: Calx-beta domain-containing protein [Acidimicrobiia bacterium]|nr:Calx-beta domain-containing protein [Acidimicrobiia bacterium]
MVIGIGIVVVLVAVAGVGYAMSGSSSAKNKDLVILSAVQRRTLQDTVTLTGTLSRKEIRKVTAASQATVSAVYSKDASVANAGDSMFSLNGRDAIAEHGDVPFFRSLTVGDRGDDVLQLKQILASAGYDPGPMDTVFTEQTRFALAQWQAQYHYPGATTITPQAATVSLTQSASYKVGPQGSVGIIIPGSGGRAASAGGATAVLSAFHPDAAAAPMPSLRVQSVNAVVSEGTPATFLITASAASGSDITVDLNWGGTATSNDVVTPPSTATLLANTTTVSVAVPTRLDNVVKPTKTLTVSLGASASYSVGAPSSAQTSITNLNVPAVHISGGTTLSPGGSATLTVTADQAPVHDTQVNVTLSGDAMPGTDYTTINPVLTLPAGRTSTSVTVTTRNNHVIQPDRHIVASITPVPGQYSVAAPGSAVITIAGATGNAALPFVTLQSAIATLQKGQPYVVTIGLSSAVSTPLTITLAYSGTAVAGTDYVVPSGTIVMPAGQTSLPVQIATVQDKLVQPDRVLTVSVAASSAYQVGSPSQASVTIQATAVPELNITASTSGVPAGGGAAFTITADQPPAQDTTVNFSIVGTAQPGVDYQPIATTVVLKAGQTQVTVVLRTLRSDVVFLPTDMIVGDWPTRVGQVYVKQGDVVTPGTPILSLTETTFTVTLQASASDRTKLAVGQHATVKLVGSQNEVDGTITELDATPTLLTQSGGASAQTGGQAGGGQGAQQVYEGKIQVSDLGAADGAAVSIDVVDQEKPNAITVPIAAVKQNGQGVDVVRVIDLNNRGHITEVAVTTGLSEGSYIEITKGLRGDETVVVDVQKPS